MAKPAKTPRPKKAKADPNVPPEPWAKAKADPSIPPEPQADAKADAPPAAPVIHQPLPVAGYTEQAAARVALVNANKALEEHLLRHIDRLYIKSEFCDRRWLAIATTHIEQGFMALNRAVSRPQRITLPGDKKD